MGWGLTIKDVFVGGVTKDSLDGEIEQSESIIKSYETELKMLISSSPSCLSVPDGYFDNDERTDNGWVEWLPSKVDGLLYEYTEEIKRLSLLYAARDNKSYDDY